MNKQTGIYKRESMLPIRDLEKLAGEPDCAIFKVRQEVHIALHPKYLNDLPLGLLTYFNKQINTWHVGLKGILAGYGKLQLKNPHGNLINEEAHIHLDVISDFWVFRPERGTTLKGIVTKKSASHVSCLVHGIFNVPCHRPADDDGSWAAKIKLNSQVRLEVIRTDMSQKVPYILGSLISTEGAVKRGSSGPVEVVDPSKWEEKLNKSPKSRGKKVPNGAPFPALPTMPLPPAMLQNPLPVALPQNPVSMDALAPITAENSSPPEAIVAQVGQQGVSPQPAINLNSMLRNLAPVKEMEPEKKKRKLGTSLPDSIGEIVNKVVNNPAMRAAPNPPRSNGVEGTPTPAPVAKFTSTPIVREEVTESGKKKKKKKRLHHEDEVPGSPMLFRQAGEEDDTPAKKKKKKKDKSRDLEKSVAMEESTSETPKKKKKDKSRDLGESVAMEESTSETPKKKKKKKKHRSEEEALKNSLIEDMKKKQRQ